MADIGWKNITTGRRILLHSDSMKQPRTCACTRLCGGVAPGAPAGVQFCLHDHVVPLFIYLIFFDAGWMQKGARVRIHHRRTTGLVEYAERDDPYVGKRNNKLREMMRENWASTQRQDDAYVHIP